MKAPDKIYIAESLIKKPYGNEWSPTEYVSRENTEYIRKDALLEWANYYLKEPPASLLDEGVDMAMRLLIEKIESL